MTIPWMDIAIVVVLAWPMGLLLRLAPERALPSRVVGLRRSDVVDALLVVVGCGVAVLALTGFVPGALAWLAVLAAVMLAALRCFLRPRSS
jgi:hypothetical protein